jgi:hypothetical protein
VGCPQITQIDTNPDKTFSAKFALQEALFAFVDAGLGVQS